MTDIDTSPEEAEARIILELRKRLVRLFIDTMILEILSAAEKPKSKHYILDRVEDIFGSTITDEEMLNVLVAMEKLGWVQGQNRQTNGFTRRFYSLSDAGNKRLDECLKYNDELISFLKIILEGDPRGNSAFRDY